MKIVSGKTGTPHVTPEQFRQIIEGTIGQGSYILTSGENLEPELASNNMLKIRGGMMSHHGNVSCVELNTYDEVTLTNGSQGVKRIDLVVNRYTRNDETGLEKNEWIVIIGTPDASSPKVPEHISGNLQNGDLTDDCPVFEVHYDGINVTEVKKLLPVMDNLESLNGKITEQNTLWDGFLYMQDGQEVKLSTPIDQTKSGIVLVFSFVENEKAQDYAWHSFFVPKALVESRPGDGHQFNLFWNTWSQKYLYIHNDKIVGQPTNSNTQNKRFGLRKIIAV